MLGAELSPLSAGEEPLALKLLARLSHGDLLLADRNFLSHGLLKAALDAGVHVLWRAKSDVDLPVLKVLPDGTYLSRVSARPAASRRMRRKGAHPKDIPGIPVRVIEYSVASDDGSEVPETFTLVSDITDPAALSAEQAADAYARRWELETCFDELEDLHPRRRRRRAALAVPADDPAGDLRHALLLPGHPHPDQPRRRRRRP